MKKLLAVLLSVILLLGIIPLIHCLDDITPSVSIEECPKRLQSPRILRRTKTHRLRRSRYDMSTDGGDFVYTCSTNNEVCTMPADIVEQIWQDCKTLNKSPDFIPHGFLLDVVPDEIINGKDIAKIKHK